MIPNINVVESVLSYTKQYKLSEIPSDLKELESLKNAQETNRAQAQNFWNALHNRKFVTRLFHATCKGMDRPGRVAVADQILKASKDLETIIEIHNKNLTLINSAIEYRLGK